MLNLEFFADAALQCEFITIFSSQYEITSDPLSSHRRWVIMNGYAGAFFVSKSTLRKAQPTTKED